jgi:hypothetical protein
MKRPRWRVCLAGFAWIVLLSGGGPVGAGEFTPVSQLREVRSDTVDATTGYTCLEGGTGPPLPGCPIDLGTLTHSDANSAADFLPFAATVTTPGGSANQTSSIGAAAVHAEGSSDSSASATEITDSAYVLVLRTVDPSTVDDFQVMFSLDEASAFEFEASGQIAYPDPSFPLIWDAALDVSLTGPGGEIASFQAVVDPFCVPDPTFICTVAPTPVFLSGVLAPGGYTLALELTTSAAGSWLPSVGPLAGGASGAYDVELRLVSGATPVPSVRGGGRAALAASLGALGAIAASGFRWRPRDRPASGRRCQLVGSAGGSAGTNTTRGLAARRRP